MTLTKEKIRGILRKGCPNCNSRNLVIDSTEQLRRTASIDEQCMDDILYGDPEYIDTVSDDFVICRDCWWQEPEE